MIVENLKEPHPRQEHRRVSGCTKEFLQLLWIHRCNHVAAEWCEATRAGIDEDERSLAGTRSELIRQNVAEKQRRALDVKRITVPCRDPVAARAVEAMAGVVEDEKVVGRERLDRRCQIVLETGARSLAVEQQCKTQTIPG